MGQEHVNVLIGELLGGKSIQSVQKMPDVKSQVNSPPPGPR